MWLRWYEGTTGDPKFIVISRKTGHPVAFVLGVWAMLLERASEASPRGTIIGFDCEAADALLGLPEGAACAIVEAMQQKKLINEERICNWAKRQPLREREPEAPGSSTQRSRECRARKKAQAMLLSRGRSEEPLQQPATLSNAWQRHATDATTSNGLDKIRVEENKKDLLSPRSTEIEDRVRVRDLRQGKQLEEDSSHTHFSEKTIPEPEPGLEFQELRQFYDQHLRAEGALSGFVEYKQLRASKRWPGQTRIYDDLNQRLVARSWDPGFAPSLQRYLRERYWESPIKPAPQKDLNQSFFSFKNGSSVTEHNYLVMQKVLAELKQEKDLYEQCQ